MINIYDVQDCYKQTLKAGATPHRNPDFKKIYEDYAPHTTVRGRLWFIEEHNTGYDGVLQRWEFWIPDTTVRFWADLLPGLLSHETKPGVAQ